jgi:hypothetical protein
VSRKILQPWSRAVDAKLLFLTSESFPAKSLDQSRQKQFAGLHQMLTMKIGTNDNQGDRMSL